MFAYVAGESNNDVCSWNFYVIFRKLFYDKFNNNHV